VTHLWLQSEIQAWNASELAGADLRLKQVLTEALGEDSVVSQVSAKVHLVRTGQENQCEWVILAAPEGNISINGFPLLLGMKVLRDRDEIRWSPNGFAYFSTEELAAVVNLPQGGRKIMCPRCKQEIIPETAAVRCPRCGVWHHQSDQLPCYTYSECCATCSRQTSLAAGYDWVPEAM